MKLDKDFVQAIRDEIITTCAPDPFGTMKLIGLDIAPKHALLFFADSKGDGYFQITNIGNYASIEIVRKVFTETEYKLVKLGQQHIKEAAA